MKQALSGETEEIVWDEQEDVYRPTPVDVCALVQTFGLKRVPEIRQGQSVIFVRRQAFARLQAHMKGDLSVEQGGLLIGQAFRDEAKAAYLLLIEEALPAREAIETATTVEYTAASWAKILPRLQAMNANWTVLGSYHSHPGHGVFLSQTDLDTQAGVFSQDWQIALVVDPVADTIGFFLGANGKPCPNWFLIETK